MDINLPITSFFNKKNSNKKEDIFFHFSLKTDDRTDLIYLEKYKKNPSLRYRHKWLTCFEPENHLDNLVEKLISSYFYKNNINIFGYSFKDDTTLNRLKVIFSNSKFQHNIKTSTEIGLPSNGACLDSLFKFTSSDNFEEITKLNGKADILLVRHVIEHSWDVVNFLKCLKLLISKDGLIVFEIPDCENGLRKGMQTLLWEEHASYFTEESLIKILNINGFGIEEVIRYPNQIEDSIVVITKLDNQKVIFNNEQKGKFLLETFKDNFEKNKLKIRNQIEEMISLGYKICMFGAGHHASSFVSINEISNYVDFVVDDNEFKQEYNLAGSEIPILSSSVLAKKDHPIFLLLTTNPEINFKLNKIIKDLNQFIIVKSIFDFYK